VSPRPALTPERVTQWLRDALGEPYQYVGRFAGGETGAFEVRSADGERSVLKWNTDARAFTPRARAVELTDRLRTVGGWPVPRQRVVELTMDGSLVDASAPTSAGDDRCQVILQEVLPGHPVTTLTTSLADELVSLVERARGLASEGDGSPLRDTVVETLIHGGQGYCQHEPMRTYDTRTKDLVERIEAIGRSVRDAAAPDAMDVVHFDLHPGNVLEVNGAVTGIIDAEYATIGDAGFDLVTLAVCSADHDPEPGVQDALWEHVEREITEPWRTAYIAHILLRNVDWSIRNHGPDDVEQWLAEADRRIPR
jgi:Ser/Thr protein kinase RdoA (MazF antagonist)